MSEQKDEIVWGTRTEAAVAPANEPTGTPTPVAPVNVPTSAQKALTVLFARERENRKGDLDFPAFIAFVDAEFGRLQDDAAKELGLKRGKK